MAYREINLYKTQSDVNPAVVAAMQTLWRASLVGVIAVSVVWIIVYSVYLFFSVRKDNLKKEQLILVQTITGLSGREALLSHVKKQAGVAQKALASQKPLDEAISELEHVGGAMSLRSFSINDQLIVAAEFDAPSIDLVLSAIQIIHTEDQAKRVVNPTIRKFSIGKDGKLTLSLSFVPVF